MTNGNAQIETVTDLQDSETASVNDFDDKYNNLERIITTHLPIMEGPPEPPVEEISRTLLKPFPRTRGKLLTVEEEKMICSMYARLCKMDKKQRSELASCTPRDIITFLTRVSSATLTKVVTKVQNNGGHYPIIQDPAKRGRQYRRIRRRELENEFRSLVDYLNEKGETVTSKKLRKLVFDKTGDIISRHSVRRMLNELGYVYRNFRGARTYAETDDLKRKRRAYLIERHKTRRMIEGAKDPGIYLPIWLDESYCNQHHVSGRTWRLNNGSDYVRRGNKGRRWIIVHAGSPIGWVGEEGIWEANKGDGDYHDNMNSANFETYFTKLCQWLSENGIHGAIHMDNAKYHRAYDKKPLHQLKVDELVDLLKLDYGVPLEKYTTKTKTRSKKTGEFYCFKSRNDLINLARVS